MEKDKSVILVDGHAVLYSSFWATMPVNYFSASNKEAVMKDVMQTDGQFTNGAYSMIRILLNLVSDYEPSHIAVTWDGYKKTKREETYSAYKGNRPPTPKPMFGQAEIVKDFCRAAGIAQFEVEGYEADDILYTLANKFKESADVYILTKDQDLLQACDVGVNVWLMTKRASGLKKKYPMGSFSNHPNIFEFTPETVEAEFGVRPDQFPDYKALVGDSVDNIPGVKGVGDSAAVPLVQYFSTLENIYAVLEDDELNAKLSQIKRLPVKKLMEGKEDAFLSRELARLIEIDDFDAELDDLKPALDLDDMMKFLRRWKFKSLFKAVETVVEIVTS